VIRKSPVLGQLGLHETAAVDIWYILWERRQAVRGDSVKTATSSAFAIQAITVNHAVRPTAHVVEVRWHKPSDGYYKLNIDASFFEDGSGAVAAMLRNSQGELGLRSQLCIL
jgi:hypothetical protein